MLVCMIFVTLQLFQATIIHYAFEARKLVVENTKPVFELAARVASRVRSFSIQVRFRLQTVSNSFAVYRALKS